MINFESAATRACLTQVRMTDTVVFAHPGCAPVAQHGARALHEAGLLAAYVTTFNYERTSSLGRFLRFSLRARYRDSEKQLARRQITELPVELIHSYPLPEMIRMAAAQVGPITGDLVWERTEKWFDSIVSRRHLSGTAAVYGYEHACLQSFRTQKDRGGLCLYEMSTSHHGETLDILYPEFEKYCVPIFLSPQTWPRRRCPCWQPSFSPSGLSDI